MSKADELFDELGYVKDYLITYTFVVMQHQFDICFSSFYKTYIIKEHYYDKKGNYQTREIDINDTSSEVAEAINKKMEELGWK